MFLTLSKQIISRFFVARLLRMTLRQVRATCGKPTTLIFEGAHERHEGLGSLVGCAARTVSLWSAA
jgi:hypothetical protein